MAKENDKKQTSQKQSFADILDAFEKMEKKAKTQNKSTGQEWRYKKTEPVKKTLEAQEKALQEKKLQQKKAEEAVDQLRKKFGQDIIKRASFLPPKGGKEAPVDHMGGGISREKRTVDYEKEKIL